MDYEKQKGLKQLLQGRMDFLDQEQKRDEEDITDITLVSLLPFMLFMTTFLVNWYDYGVTDTKLHGLSESQVRSYWSKEDNRSDFRKLRGFIGASGRELAYQLYK
ncbi:MAG: hypothetical protein Q8R47_00535 [Nanoarchaeota archaeon]|nr:hypothetical protein [Nanoarchaeota archaeon]